jgi:hypothetical protein
VQLGYVLLQNTYPCPSSLRKSSIPNIFLIFARATRENSVVTTSVIASHNSKVITANINSTLSLRASKMLTIWKSYSELTMCTLWPTKASVWSQSSIWAWDSPLVNFHMWQSPWTALKIPQLSKSDLKLSKWTILFIRVCSSLLTNNLCQIKFL